MSVLQNRAETVLVTRTLPAFFLMVSIEQLLMQVSGMNPYYLG